MPLATAGQNAMLTGGLGNVAVFASLHTGDPSTTGANEVTGGSPAYARKAITWNTVGSGQRTNNGALAFDIPAATTVYWVGLWSALTTGTYYGAFPCQTTGAAPKAALVLSGDVTANTIECVSHGFSAGDRVTCYPVLAGSLPTGLTAGVVYYVIATGLATDVLEVSTSSGGSAVDITGEGPLMVQKVVPEVFAGQGTYTVADASLVLDARAVV